MNEKIMSRHFVTLVFLMITPWPTINPEAETRRHTIRPQQPDVNKYLMKAAQPIPLNKMKYCLLGGSGGAVYVEAAVTLRTDITPNNVTYGCEVYLDNSYEKRGSTYITLIEGSRDDQLKHIVRCDVTREDWSKGMLKCEATLPITNIHVGHNVYYCEYKQGDDLCRSDEIYFYKLIEMRRHMISKRQTKRPWKDVSDHVLIDVVGVELGQVLYESGLMFSWTYFPNTSVNYTCGMLISTDGMLGKITISEALLEGEAIIDSLNTDVVKEKHTSKVCATKNVDPNRQADAIICEINRPVMESDLGYKIYTCTIKYADGHEKVHDIKVHTYIDEDYLGVLDRRDRQKNRTVKEENSDSNNQDKIRKAEKIEREKQERETKRKLDELTSKLKAAEKAKEKALKDIDKMKLIRMETLKKINETNQRIEAEEANQKIQDEIRQEKWEKDERDKKNKWATDLEALRVAKETVDNNITELNKNINEFETTQDQASTIEDVKDNMQKTENEGKIKEAEEQAKQQDLFWANCLKEAIDARKTAEDTVKMLISEKAQMETNQIELNIKKTQQKAKKNAERVANALKADKQAKLNEREWANNLSALIETCQNAENETKILKEEKTQWQAAEDEANRLKKIEEFNKLKAEEDARQRAKDEAKRQKYEDDAKKLKAEIDARKNAEDKINKLKAVEEARQKAKDEANRLKADQEASQKAQDEANRKKAESEANWANLPWNTHPSEGAGIRLNGENGNDFQGAWTSPICEQSTDNVYRSRF